MVEAPDSVMEKLMVWILILFMTFPLTPNNPQLVGSGWWAPRVVLRRRRQPTSVSFSSVQGGIYQTGKPICAPPCQFSWCCLSVWTTSNVRPIWRWLFLVLSKRITKTLPLSAPFSSWRSMACFDFFSFILCLMCTIGCLQRKDSTAVKETMPWQISIVIPPKLDIVRPPSAIL